MSDEDNDLRYISTPALWGYAGAGVFYCPVIQRKQEATSLFNCTTGYLKPDGKPIVYLGNVWCPLPDDKAIVYADHAAIIADGWKVD